MISLTQFQKATGKARNTVISAISSLVSSGLICCVHGKKINSYSINREKTVALVQNLNQCKNSTSSKIEPLLVQKLNHPSSKIELEEFKNCTSTSSKIEHTKEKKTIIKDIYTKEKERKGKSVHDVLRTMNEDPQKINFSSFPIQDQIDEIAKIYSLGTNQKPLESTKRMICECLQECDFEDIKKAVQNYIGSPWHKENKVWAPKRIFNSESIEIWKNQEPKPKNYDHLFDHRDNAMIVKLGDIKKIIGDKYQEFAEAGRTKEKFLELINEQT